MRLLPTISLALIAVACERDPRIAVSPAVTCVPGRLDLGKVPFMGYAGGVIELVNDSSRPFQIMTITTGCSCTITGYSRKLLEPGSSSTVTISYHARVRGQWELPVHVMLKEEGARHDIERSCLLTGYTMPDLFVEPPEVRELTLEGEVHTRDIVLYYHRGAKDKEMAIGLISVVPEGMQVVLGDSQVRVSSTDVCDEQAIKLLVPTVPAEGVDGKIDISFSEPSGLRKIIVVKARRQN